MKAEELLLIRRSLDDELNELEVHHLQRLLDSSTEARVELKQFEQARGLVAEYGSGSFSYGFADRVMEQVVGIRPNPGSASLRLPAWIPSWPMVGWSLAVAVVLLGIGLALWLRPHTVQVPRGATAFVTLPDGTTVDLSGGSTLRYGRFVGSSERRVELNGEAFFDVAHAARPFVVETFNARVVVRGTRFNVRAWAADPDHATAVTLETGRVEVMPRGPAAQPVVLAPGETSHVVGDTSAAHAPVVIPLERALAWRSGGLAFTDQPLRSVFNALERRFDVEITLAAPGLADLPQTYLNPHPTSLTDVLSDICNTHGLHYRRTAHGFSVVRE